MKVSVIIPFYKVEAFIGRCAESLLGQSLDDVEFIFVDDASPDGSASVLCDVVSRHPSRDVKILRHEVNRGLPAARNTGLAAATGDFIYHCDSDDYLEKNALQTLWTAAVTNGADYAYCDFYLETESSSRVLDNPAFSDSGRMLREGFLSGRMKYNVWNKLVARSVYERSGVLFPDGHSMGEDMTMILLALHSVRPVRVPVPLYHYMRTNPSAFTAGPSSASASASSASAGPSSASASHAGVLPGSPSVISSEVEKSRLDDIRFNADRVLAALEGRVEPEFIAFFKLSLKLPFLFDGKPGYERWKQWYPEANGYILKNRFLPLRTRLVQLAARLGLYPLVALYADLLSRRGQ
ncbi:MAG: glycosyltransferase family 2 protein [Bacteroidales bacterium]|nr:glycosyltransferase family 2 protein [Bacteroidales bacterium]